MNTDQKIEWCKQCHRDTNHNYDGYLPYEYHLNMVASVANKFLQYPERMWSELEIACYAHDLIEDCRVTYNDVKQMLGEYVANIVYAVTNEKGKNRSERANGIYYKGIAQTEGATFVKLCDRIANVEYSKMTGSKMFEVYKKENESFCFNLAGSEAVRCQPMIDYLINLFNS